MTLQEMKPKASRKEERQKGRRKRNRLVVLVVAMFSAAALAAYFFGAYSPLGGRSPVEYLVEAYAPSANEQPTKTAEPADS